MRGNKGFTLLETILALALLSIVVISFTLIVGASSNLNQASERMQADLDQSVSDIENGRNLSDTQGTITLTTPGGTVQIPVTFWQTTSQVELKKFE